MTRSSSQANRQQESQAKSPDASYPEDGVQSTTATMGEAQSQSIPYRLEQGTAMPFLFFCLHGRHPAHSPCNHHPGDNFIHKFNDNANCKDGQCLQLNVVGMGMEMGPPCFRTSPPIPYIIKRSRRQSSRNAPCLRLHLAHMPSVLLS